MVVSHRWMLIVEMYKVRDLLAVSAGVSVIYDLNRLVVDPIFLVTSPQLFLCRVVDFEVV